MQPLAWWLATFTFVDLIYLPIYGWIWLFARLDCSRVVDVHYTFGRCRFDFPNLAGDLRTVDCSAR